VLDKINVFELYNGLMIANEEAPQLQLRETIQLLENRNPLLLDHNETFKSLKLRDYDPKFIAE
jgi:hypothetical protein